MLITGRFKQTALATLPALLVLAGTALAQDAAAPTPTLDTGDTAWMLTSTALVLMMTIPGLALFYGGMVRKKNVLSTVMQSFAVTCLMSVLWMVVGYSLAFTDGGSMNAYIGGFSKAFFSGVTMDSLTGTIPEYLFIVFQMTFAVITPALIAGSFAERMKFSSMLVFLTLWLFIVYIPVAHWVWGGGFLGSDGVLDFAGGTVVHINAGVAGLVAALIIGKRDGYGQTNMAPHNLVLSVIGAALLWVGWFGFNAGSALGANSLAAVAMLNTQVATAGAALAWMFAEWAIAGKPSVLGIISGAVAGLVAVTPAAGFVNPMGALILGIIAGAVCYVAAVKIKHALGYDDSLDAFGVHGVGGFVGAILTGVFADATINAAGEGATVGKQFFGAAITVVYTAVATAIILYVVKAVMGLRPSKQAEMEGLDIALHGESVQ
ncbi:ammonium transporter [Brucella pituitosa]|uniref:Ammonium transporter n=1 Tax=Brucella pituitosa TaxID=571256 RepID=A0A643F2X6_9HYPH|nr:MULTISPECIES: ammonium transporter [Brucella]PQZ48827.1 ammonium transporter [Ochrobactrum sp. MYb19]PRA57968.1 ammonium transporter [Ochrobactrum sp. MYb68]PRA67356.1 ammonium transporter [Ochrobactrum sp. MYb18]PRA77685.1 ammonium transporter [Brucella thiophenivorans]PRA88616.1 ammonium transporter [Ochrobactrum sp. MYb29]PRA92365.1 ammonium transporter [Ochrobactrum sp. MYb14]PRA99694.1 ammonium transporter [Ochrobactrum sp. MYb15]TCQ81678.1 ammonium transporter [Ochrobactrum sp. BH3